MGKERLAGTDHHHNYHHSVCTSNPSTFHLTATSLPSPWHLRVSLSSTCPAVAFSDIARDDNIPTIPVHKSILSSTAFLVRRFLTPALFSSPLLQLVRLTSHTSAPDHCQFW